MQWIRIDEQYLKTLAIIEKDEAMDGNHRFLLKKLSK